MWKLLETGKAAAEENMLLDALLLKELDPKGPAILHFYEWSQPSATYGHFIDTTQFLDLASVQKHKLTLAKRPTGGGIVLHVSDLAFSVLVPAEHEGYSENVLDNYHYVNQKVIQAIESMMKKAGLQLLPANPVPFDGSCASFCMAKPTIFDVMIGDKKIAGAAQRKRKQGFLHQGSISIALPQESFLAEILLPHTRVLEAMQVHTHVMLKSPWTDHDLEEIREMLKEHLKRVFLEGSI